MEGTCQKFTKCKISCCVLWCQREICFMTLKHAPWLTWHAKLHPAYVTIWRWSQNRSRTIKFFRPFLSRIKEKKSQIAFSEDSSRVNDHWALICHFITFAMTSHHPENMASKQKKATVEVCHIKKIYIEANGETHATTSQFDFDQRDKFIKRNHLKLVWAQKTLFW